MTRSDIHDRIFWFCCYAVVFFIPVYARIIPPFIILMTLNWLAGGQALRNFRKMREEPWRMMVLLPAAIYLVYLAGMLYSSNTAYGWLDLEIKLSLLVFPLIFSTTDIRPEAGKTGKLLQLFVLACLVNSIALFGRALIRWYDTGDTALFYYSNLSWMFHATYLAMYVAFAIAITGFGLIAGWEAMTRRQRFIRLVIIAWLMAFVVLLSSRAGILSLFMVNFLVSSALLFRKGMRIKGLVVLAVSTLYLLALVRTLPYSVNRTDFREAAAVAAGSADATGGNSSTDRIGILKASLSALKDHWLIGTGTGDVKDVLLEKYRERNLDHALKLKLNAHNQYLQTFLATGIAGIAALLLTLIVPMIGALMRRRLLYLTFLSLFAFNLLFESMLEVQAGVVFFAFFYTLFLPQE